MIGNRELERTLGMRRSVRAFALLLALTSVAAACGATKDTGFPAPAESETASSPGTGLASPAASPTGGGGASGTAAVEVIDNDFRPKELTVGAGTEVVWSQTGVQPHTVTAEDKAFDSSPEPCPVDQSKCLQRGQTFSWTFSKPGRYPYYCKLHGAPGGLAMAGVIVVR